MQGLRKQANHLVAGLGGQDDRLLRHGPTVERCTHNWEVPCLIAAPVLLPLLALAGGVTAGYFVGPASRCRDGASTA